MAVRMARRIEAKTSKERRVSQHEREEGEQMEQVHTLQPKARDDESTRKRTARFTTSRSPARRSVAHSRRAPLSGAIDLQQTEWLSAFRAFVRAGYGGPRYRGPTLDDRATATSPATLIQREPTPMWLAPRIQGPHGQARPNRRPDPGNGPAPRGAHAP
jgi:hypothetical protein